MPEYLEVEWAVERVNDNGSYCTSSPYYRYEHAKRHLTEWPEGSYIVSREIDAKPWRPVLTMLDSKTNPVDGTP